MKEIGTGIYACGNCKGYWVRVAKDCSAHFIKHPDIVSAGAIAISKFGAIVDIKEKKKDLLTV